MQRCIENELQHNFKQMKLKSTQRTFIPVKQRVKHLLMLKDLIQMHTKALSNAVSADFSYRSPHETYLMELFPVVNSLKFCIRHVKAWAKDRKRQVSWLFKPARAWISPQPLGVVGIIVPWNYPLLLALEPLAYALAAGNRVMLKMSELTPMTGLLLAKIIQGSVLGEQVKIINGDASSAKYFSDLPFDHLFFTGSTRVGKEILRATANNLTPVTLELGGKSPAVISSTVDLHHLPRLFMGKFANAGQTCVAPDYLCIPEGFENRLIESLDDFVNKHYPQFPSDDAYSAIISQPHYDRLQGLLQDAIEKGARVVKILAKKGSATTLRKMPLYLLFNVQQTMRVMQEEIFGPLLPVLSFNRFQEVKEIILANPDPLVIYYFGSSKEEKDLLRLSVRSGALSINDTLTHVAIDDLPFGGIGRSGIGAYHGREGFDRFSSLKPIFLQSNFSLNTWFYPQVSAGMRQLLKYLIGR
ncbi:MAG: aldehyde dehydrogenase family protein [Legionella sp.]|nr:aldehyde dehydrogenase family protein [Legionella sp.]